MPPCVAAALHALWLAGACCRPVAGAYMDKLPSRPPVEEKDMADSVEELSEVVVDYGNHRDLSRSGNGAVTTNFYWGDPAKVNNTVTFTRATDDESNGFFYVAPKGFLGEASVLQAKAAKRALDELIASDKQCLKVHHQFPAREDKDTNLCASHSLTDALLRITTEENVNRHDVFGQIADGKQSYASFTGIRKVLRRADFGSLMGSSKWLAKQWWPIGEQKGNRMQALWKYLAAKDKNEFPAMVTAYTLCDEARKKMRQQSPLDGVTNLLSEEDTGRIVNFFTGNFDGVADTQDVCFSFPGHAVMIAGVFEANAEGCLEKPEACKFFIIKDSYGDHRHYHGYFLADLTFPFDTFTEFAVADGTTVDALDKLFEGTSFLYGSSGYKCKEIRDFDGPLPDGAAALGAPTQFCLSQSD